MSKSPDRSNDLGDTVPDILRQWLSPFRFRFTAPSWSHLLVLVMGALLSPGKRTVTACLRIIGRAEVGNFAAYHQFLNRARWNSRVLSASLLAIIVDQFVPDGPVVIGMDDTIERRWGQRIAARGIYVCDGSAISAGKRVPPGSAIAALRPASVPQAAPEDPDAPAVANRRAGLR